MVEDTVMSMEFPKDLQKFIFCIASGKFFKVNPWEPTNARGLELISPFTLNTLINTSRNGKIKHMNNTISNTIKTACLIFLFLAALAFKSSIMLTPPLSYQCLPEARLPLRIQ